VVIRAQLSPFAMDRGNNQWEKPDIRSSQGWRLEMQPGGFDLDSDLSGFRNKFSSVPLHVEAARARANCL
jgi:hypothetical protein